MALSAPEFIRLVMDRLEVDGPTALTRRMRWDVNSPQKISRWLAGINEPDFEATMEMAEAAGLLSGQQPVPQVRDPEDRLEALAAVGREVLQNQKLILELLGELAAAAGIPGRAAKARPKRSGNHS